MEIVSVISRLLSILTVATQASLVMGLIAFLLLRCDRGSRFRDFLWRRALVLSFLIAAVATVGSLFYSLVAGYPPCDLCWYQRIFMYPLVITLPMAMAKKDRGAADYSLVLAVTGLIISAYHNYIYSIGSAGSVCAIGSGSVSCLARYVSDFHYVTIPVMALTAFTAIGFLLLVARRRAI